MSQLIFWQYVGWAVLALIVIGVVVLVTMLVKDSKRKKNEVPVALPSLRPVSAEEETARAIFDGTETVTPLSRKARKQTGATGPSKEALPAKSSAFFDSDDDEDFKLPSGSD